MRIIKTLKDIELLKSASVINEEVLEEIELHFKNIYNNLGEGVSIEEFSLKDSGIIIFLEPGDNVTDLEEIGLDGEEGGLLGVSPEWIDEQELGNCTLATICTVLNNEYTLSIFLEKGKFGQEVETWIEENR